MKRNRTRRYCKICSCDMPIIHVCTQPARAPKPVPDTRTKVERDAAIRAMHGVKFDEPTQVTVGGSMTGARL